MALALASYSEHFKQRAAEILETWLTECLALYERLYGQSSFYTLSNLDFALLFQS